MAKKSQRVILVTGATGKQGGAVLHHLQGRGFSIRILTRHPDKPAARALIGGGVDVVQGDLNDPASLTRALEDVYGVYSVQESRGGAEAEIRQGINLADAANRSGVSHLVYSSVGSADQNTGIPHFDSKFRIEEHLRSTGIRYTIFRPVFFMENWFGSKDQIEEGILAQPLNPETRLQMIAVDDIGAFVAAAFEHPGHWEGRAIDIAGDELSMTEIAEAFSRSVGREVRYRQVPWDAFEEQAGHEITVMYQWFQNVGYHVDIAALRQELPSLTSFDRWLNNTWQPAISKGGRRANA
jgi:uncharacterized protein YbjT (DUF2867 family)